ncbi:ABC transporter substrate-binding protein [Anopheles sinensis]|uniref:ABC transporter substrate-binding protein n=1 Tax=Anopheles sinensis TaxID=74873 RepID=A0A084VY10_ANOSI|nr:ABC transporter substrate-binding protein [Anopheles sinensis]
MYTEPAAPTEAAKDCVRQSAIADGKASEIQYCPARGARASGKLEAQPKV